MLRVSSILYLQRLWSRPPNMLPHIPGPSNVQQQDISATIHNVSSVTIVSSSQQLLNKQEHQKNEQERLKHEQELLDNEQDLYLLMNERLKKEKELEALQLERKKLEQEEQLKRMKLERQKEKEQREKIKFERQRKILEEQQQQEERQLKEHLEQERLVQERLNGERLLKERLIVEKHPAAEEESTAMPSTPSITGDFSNSSSSTNLFERIFPAMPHETPFHPYTLPLITTRNHDRDYYDDDLSSDLDSENIIDQLPTPPSTPNKFSPKRILHKAKSSINDDSVRNLGRRTSLFFEKKLAPPTSDDFSISSLRRGSSKISVKGKSLTKKLKRVLSFRQS